MPGIWHDSANELFKDDPEFARRLFRLAGVELPLDVQFIQAPTSETDRMISNDLDPDTVLVAGRVKRPKRVIIVELQQAWDPGKLRQWPRYAASKWLRYECPVQLLVICPGIRAQRIGAPHSDEVQRAFQQARPDLLRPGPRGRPRGRPRGGAGRWRARHRAHGPEGPRPAGQRRPAVAYRRLRRPRRPQGLGPGRPDRRGGRRSVQLIAACPPRPSTRCRAATR